MLGRQAGAVQRGMASGTSRQARESQSAPHSASACSPAPTPLRVPQPASHTAGQHMADSPSRADGAGGGSGGSGGLAFVLVPHTEAHGTGASPRSVHDARCDSSGGWGSPLSEVGSDNVDSDSGADTSTSARMESSSSASGPFPSQSVPQATAHAGVSPVPRAAHTGPAGTRSVRGARGGGLLRICVTPARSLTTRKDSRTAQVGCGSKRAAIDPRLRLRAAASSMLGRRCSNEDAHALLLPCTELGDGIAWCGVFDGHGGDAASAYAAAHLHEAVAAQLRAANVLQVPAVRCQDTAACPILGRTLVDEDVDMRCDSGSSADSCASGAHSPVPGEPRVEPRVERSTSTGSAASSGISIGMGSAVSCDTHMGEPTSHDTGDVDNGSRPSVVPGGEAAGSPDVLAGSPEAVARAISRGYIDFDIQMYQELFKKADPEESGTTALVAIVTPTKLVVANTGDSRAVMCRRGKAVRLSEDHKPTDPRERRRIIAAGGRVMGGRINGLAVSRVLGDFDIKPTPVIGEGRYRLTGRQLAPHPDVRVESWDPEQDEFVILACDGVWDVMDDQECVAFVRAELLRRCKSVSSRSLVRHSKGHRRSAARSVRAKVGAGGRARAASSGSPLGVGARWRREPAPAGAAAASAGLATPSAGAAPRAPGLPRRSHSTRSPASTPGARRAGPHRRKPGQRRASPASAHGASPARGRRSGSGERRGGLSGRVRKRSCSPAVSSGDESVGSPFAPPADVHEQGSGSTTAGPPRQPRGMFSHLGPDALRAVTEALLDKCFALGSDDNITAVILVR